MVGFSPVDLSFVYSNKQWSWWTKIQETVHPNPILVLLFVRTKVECRKGLQCIYTYFKKGCFSDACFIDHSALCSLNLWLPFSSY